MAYIFLCGAVVPVFLKVSIFKLLCSVLMEGDSSNGETNRFNKHSIPVAFIHLLICVVQFNSKSHQCCATFALMIPLITKDKSYVVVFISCLICTVFPQHFY